jgi:amino-acid N-acetyltransferase
LKNPKKHAPSDVVATTPSQQQNPFSKPEVNVGNLFGRARAVDESPVFTQHQDVRAESSQETETVHVALVKIVDVDKLSDDILRGIAQTLSQLSRLSMAPCVVLESSAPPGLAWRQEASKQAGILAAAIDSVHKQGSRMLDSIMSLSEEKVPEVFLRKLLLRPLRRGQIPIVVPLAYSTTSQIATPVSADDTILALTREFAGLNLKPLQEKSPTSADDQYKALQRQTSLDRIILIDAAGGIPSKGVERKTEIFINLEQEYSDLETEFAGLKDNPSAERHASNLRLLHNALQLLPPSSSGLITTPANAGNKVKREQEIQLSGVGTRRQKNALIHNLLTDKPAYSSSLPCGRLGRGNGSDVPPVVSASTFVKRGMPLIILPDPMSKPWTANNYGEPRLKLTDPRIDLPRLVHLIDDSFDRKLDVEHYLNRVNDRIAGIIIAGEYDGGALLTWETPPGAEDGDTSRLVPYLDKFAVLKRSQGTGSVADILFNAMVRKCFPNGVCWRSRKDNPVNKWYFERSRGTWKIPETNWTMFWTTPNLVAQGQTFLDYEAVCRGVLPSWADKKKIVD